MNIVARAVGLSLLLLFPVAGDAAPPPSSARTNPPGCMPTEVTIPSDASGSAPATVTVRFEIGEGGTAQDVSVGFPVDAVVSDLLAQAATRAVQACTWELASDKGDAPASRRVALKLPVVRAMSKANRWIPPKMREKSCFRDAFDFGQLTVTKDLKVMAKFAVYSDGTTGRARLLERFDDPAIQESLENSITSAVKACEWLPGSDEQGRTVPMYVLMPINLRP